MLVILGHSRGTLSTQRMKELDQATVPIAYVLLIAGLAEERGVPHVRLLEGLDVDPRTFDRPDARLSLRQTTRILLRALKHSGDAALGYEIGLRSSLSSHGFVGYGLLSLATLRQALEFGIRFTRLRTPFIGLRYFVDGQQGVIEASEELPLEELRPLIFDMFLVGLWRMAPQLAAGGPAMPDVELCFDYPEPDYYERYRDRLPVTRFSRPANQLRFPASFLDQQLQSANPTTAQLITEQCERELSLLGPTDLDTARRVQTLLTELGPPYPQLGVLADRMRVSSRSLKRQLQKSGTSYLRELEKARSAEARRVLRETHLSVAKVAEHLGYADPANFTRAFRKWTGQTPSAYRVSSAAAAD